MAELPPKERLMPCLLDRLTNENPSATSEPRSARAFSARQARQVVERDLAELLNTTTSLTPDEAADFPEVARSVLNYGLPDQTGRGVEDVRREIERSLLACVRAYEPRVQSKTLSVRVLDGTDAGRPQAIALELRGYVWAVPLPEPLYVRTELDLENGEFAMPRRGTSD